MRGDASGVSVGEALAEQQNAMAMNNVPPSQQLGYGGQAQMIRFSPTD